ncbi:MAG: hypothetical protein QM786_07910 [Breznakibacter sp.]
MKRMTLNIAAVALVAFAAASFDQAQATAKLETSTGIVSLMEDEVIWTQIEVKDVPEAVTKAAASKYEGSSVEKAFKGSDNTYKLVLKTGDTKVTAIFNAEGKFLKEA